MLIEAQAGLTATLKVVNVAERLHTTIELATVEVEAGTVYRVLKVVALGLDCHNTFKVVAILSSHK